jgi:hypothetical protein
MLNNLALFSKWLLLCIVVVVSGPLSQSSDILFGQDRVVVVRHGSTPEGDIIRARADAVLLLRASLQTRVL